MDKQPIAIPELHIHPFTTFDPDGILLVSGTGVDHANPMTISWGMFGIMWGRPIAMVMVRPVRHTWQFITEAPDFTLNWMPEAWVEAVRVCGSASGRDIDKFGSTGLQPVQGLNVSSPIIAQSSLAVECRTIYRDMVAPAKYLDPTIDRMYPAQDYHGLFFGEIVAAQGIPAFRVTP